MSRITLNLKKQAHRSPSVYIPQMDDIIQPMAGYVMPTVFGKAHIFGRLRSHSASARLSGSRKRSSSESSISPPARPITFARNPSPSIEPDLTGHQYPSIELTSISDDLIRVGWLRSEQNTTDIV